eukprot:SAG22_NODE_388_length_11295_cov_14.512594_9_plen_81_part_00
MRWSCDDGRVMSVGGNDRCVIQWRTHGVKTDSAKYRKQAFGGGGQAAAEIDTKLYAKLTRVQQVHTAKQVMIDDAGECMT